MKAPEFAKLFTRLPLLNQPQRQQVLAALHPAAGLDRVIALRANAVAGPPCAAAHVTSTASRQRATAADRPSMPAPVAAP
jgi:hypothetical protein